MRTTAGEQRNKMNEKTIDNPRRGRARQVRRWGWASLVACLAVFAACQRGGGAVTKLNGQAQGTYYRVLYCDPQHRNLQPSIDSLLDDFDRTASLWVDSSLLRQVNENRTVWVNDYFADMFSKSVETSRYTQGCFDCTVGKLVNAWGFGFKKRETLSDEAVDSLRQYTGSEKVRLVCDSTTQGNWRVEKQFPETEIDFNAIAQGYSVDLLARFFDERGIENYLIDVGGEVIARGQKPDGKPWSVGIERPAAGRYDSPEVQTVIALRNRSVVTSGNYRKYYEQGGVKYSHTIDPSTGRPVTHSLLSVSVIDSTAWRADAMATAFMVMGLERALQFIREHPEDDGVQAAYFIYDDGGNFATYATEAFEKMILQ